MKAVYLTVIITAAINIISLAILATAYANEGQGLHPAIAISLTAMVSAAATVATLKLLKT
jgi:uncharacterized protein YggE